MVLGSSPPFISLSLTLFMEENIWDIKNDF